MIAAVALTTLGWSGLRLASAATLANMNWLSADLSNAAFLDTACPGGWGEACGALPLPSELHSSYAGVDAVASGQADFFLECWVGAECARPGLIATHTGMVGVKALYASAALLQEFPELERLDGWRNATLLRRGQELFTVVGGREVAVYGSVTSWRSAADLHSIFEAEGLWALNASVRHFATQMEMDRTLQLALAMHRLVLFYYYEPTPLMSNQRFGVRRLTPTAQFSLTMPEQPVMKLRRAGHSAADFLPNFDAFAVRNEAMHVMMRSFSTKASPALVDSHPTYVRALKMAARCAHSGQTCEGVEEEVWPRTKAASLPAQVLVLVKECKGFVDYKNQELLVEGACEPGSALNRHPRGLRPSVDIDGYTVRHLLRVLENLGYMEQDILFQCTTSMPTLMDEVAGGYAHIGAACITQTDARMSRVDFSSAVYATGLSMLAPTSDSSADAFAFALPFTEQVWAYLFIMVVGAVAIIYTLESRHYLSAAWRRWRSRKFLPNSGSAPAKEGAGEGSATAEKGSAPHGEDSATVGDLVNAETPTGTVSGRVTRITGSGVLEIEGGHLVRTHAVRRIQRAGQVAMGIYDTSESTFTMFLGRDAQVANLKTRYGRCLGNQTVCFGVLLMQLYTSSLTTLLTVQQLNVVDSVDKIRGKTIAAASEHCESCSGSTCSPCGSMCPLDAGRQPKRTAIEEYIDDIANTGSNPMGWTRMCVPLSEKEAAVLRGDVAAVIDDHPVAFAHAKEHNDRARRCELQATQFTHHELGYIFPKGSAMRVPVSEAIVFVNSRGIRQELDMQYFTPSEYCESTSSDRLGFDQVWGLFLVYGCFVSATLLACGLQAALCPGRKPGERGWSGTSSEESGRVAV